MLRLGEDMELPHEERRLHLCKGKVRLGEGMHTQVNSRMDLVDFLVHLGEAFSRLGEPMTV